MRYSLRPLALTLSNALAMGTTFLLFVFVVRGASLESVGLFTACVAIANLYQQLSDLGYSSAAVRESQKGLAVNVAFSWLLVERLKRMATMALPLILLITFITGQFWSALLVLLAGLLLSIYSFSIAYLQARTSWGRIIGLQALNALSFLTVTLFILSDARESSEIQSLIACYVLAWIPPAIVGLMLIYPFFQLSNSGMHDFADLRHFPIALLANLITTNAATLLLSFHFASLVGAYSQLQQPALVFTPVSAALTAWLLPSLSRVPSAQLKRRMKTMALLSPIFLGFGVAGSCVIFPALSILYGRDDLEFLGLIFTFSMGSLGVVSAVVVTAFVSSGHAEVAARLAIIQAVGAIIISIVVLIAPNLLLLAGLDFVVRVVGLLYTFTRIRILDH